MGQKLTDQYLAKQMADWNRRSRKEWVGYTAEAFLVVVGQSPELLAKVVACGHEEFVRQAKVGYAGHGFTHQDLCDIFQHIRQSYLQTLGIPSLYAPGGGRG